eukprot:2740221-Pleurochrysis_carterae.AAC.3
MRPRQGTARPRMSGDARRQEKPVAAAFDRSRCLLCPEGLSQTILLCRRLQPQTRPLRAVAAATTQRARAHCARWRLRQAAPTACTHRLRPHRTLAATPCAAQGGRRKSTRRVDGSRAASAVETHATRRERVAGRAVLLRPEQAVARSAPDLALSAIIVSTAINRPMN